MNHIRRLRRELIGGARGVVHFNLSAWARRAEHTPAPFSSALVNVAAFGSVHARAAQVDLRIRPLESRAYRQGVLYAR